MANVSNTINSKAFKYACLAAVQELLRARQQDVEISDTPAFRTAQKAFLSLSADYVPILQTYLNEIRRMRGTDLDTPEKRRCDPPSTAFPIINPNCVYCN